MKAFGVVMAPEGTRGGGGDSRKVLEQIPTGVQLLILPKSVLGNQPV